jgi:RsiW-degrading membrane proteinase PrsW (M82 family)
MVSKQILSQESKMTHHDPVIAVIGASVAAQVVGPLSLVFDETAILMAVMGACGGALLALTRRAPWRVFIRPALIGALMSFGLGILAVPIISRLLGLDIGEDQFSEYLAGASFIVGFAQERVEAFILSGKEKSDDASE